MFQKIYNKQEYKPKHKKKTIETHEKNKVFGSQITKNDLWFIPN
jgi:hypothetical protein